MRFLFTVKYPAIVVHLARLQSALAIAALMLTGVAVRAEDVKTGVNLPVSYHKQIQPLLQARCQGCHQASIAGGKLVLTSYAEFMKGGASGPSVIKKKPDSSPLMEYLTGKRDLMPKGGPPLSNEELGLFRTWIAQGANDDTPVTHDPIDPAHPPVYVKPPVITALAYAPDGQTIAVSGYREILLDKTDGSGLAGRLIGQSEKILSLAYSPDGKMLAAVGGSPARFGEVQFWDAQAGKPINALLNTADTLFGASFSPDGKELAFGCADNSVRVIGVPDGHQIMRLDNHSDWVFSTAFVEDSKHALHVLSTGRDQAIKLTLVEGASFIDDINTHTSAYRCMARNPNPPKGADGKPEEQVVAAGDDGIPRLYKIFRTQVRTMNQEDHNLVRAFERQPGVSACIAFSPDGSLFAVGGEADVVNIYKAADGTKVASLKGHKGVLYALVFRPDSKQLATGGFDGMVRLYDLPTGKLAKSFVPVPIQKAKFASPQIAASARPPAHR